MPNDEEWPLGFAIAWWACWIVMGIGLGGFLWCVVTLISRGV